MTVMMYVLIMINKHKQFISFISFVLIHVTCTKEKGLIILCSVLLSMKLIYMDQTVTVENRVLFLEGDSFNYYPMDQTAQTNLIHSFNFILVPILIYRSFTPIYQHLSVLCLLFFYQSIIECLGILYIVLLYPIV